MFKTVTAILAAALALGTAGCVSVEKPPTDREVAVDAPAPTEPAAVGDSEHFDVESMLEEAGPAACTILKTRGVYKGAIDVFELADQNGLSRDVAIDILVVSIYTYCPEMAAEVERVLG